MIEGFNHNCPVVVPGVPYLLVFLIGPNPCGIGKSIKSTANPENQLANVTIEYHPLPLKKAHV